jgi:hypothetical protein
MSLQKWGNKLTIKLGELEGIQKNLGPNFFQKFPTKPNQKCQVGPKNLKEGGNNKASKKAFEQNIKRKSQKLLGLLNFKSTLA